MMMKAAKNAKVDIAVHLDHGLKIDTIATPGARLWLHLRYV